MEVKQVFTFLNEITKCEYHPNDGELTDFSYNGITISQGYETYRKMLAASYENFKICVLELSLENIASVASILAILEREREQTFYDIPDEDYIRAMERDAEKTPSLRFAIQEARFLNEMVGVQRWFFNEAIIFTKMLIGGKVERKSNVKCEEKSMASRDQETELSRKLNDYGEFLSVRDLTEIFHCDRRTISNWEAEGYIHNVADTSQETNSSGRRKRGKEKRYRKDAVLRQVKLQEKYNALLDRYSFSA